MESQTSFKLDATTVKKIIKGAIYAVAPAAALALLQYIQTIEISNPMLAIAVVYLIPVLINAVKDFKAGREQ